MSDNRGCDCACGSAPKLIFACSGAADVGQIADLAARKLNREGAGKMFCLAGIGGQVSGILETTRSASAVLAIDGCPLDCARKTLEVAEFSDFQHLRLSDVGFAKGQSEVNDAHVEIACRRGAELLAT